MNDYIKNYRIFTKLFLTICCLLIILVLAGCTGSRQPVTTTVNLEPVEFEPLEAPSEPTPIPNLRAEAVLKQSFGGFIAHLQPANITISQEELETLQAEGGGFLVDLRNPLEAKRTGHIPGAVLIPLRELGRKTSVLPEFEVPLVVYCKGTEECLIAFTGLGVYGWNIRVLDGGFDAWVSAGKPVAKGQISVPEPDPFKPAFPCCGIYEQSAEQDGIKVNPDAPDASLVAATDRIFNNVPDEFGGITAEELAQEIQEDPSLVLVDLRSTSEFQDGTQINAPNFIHIPFEQLIELHDKWPVDKTTKIIVYSQDGRISPIAMAIFWAYGYENVRELRGGLSTWNN